VGTSGEKLRNVLVPILQSCSVCVVVKSARKPRGKAAAKKVKSKEIVDEVASDDSNKEKDDGAVSGGKRRQRHGVKAKPGVVDKDGKLHRKRQSKNKVRRCILHVLPVHALITS